MTNGRMALSRRSVLAGGMVWMDSVAGSPFFYKGCTEVLKKAFPEDSLRRIPADHPIYHMVNDVEKVKLPQAAPIRSAEKARAAAVLSLPLRYRATGN